MRGKKASEKQERIELSMHVKSLRIFSWDVGYLHSPISCQKEKIMGKSNNILTRVSKLVSPTGDRWTLYASRCNVQKGSITFLLCSNLVENIQLQSNHQANTKWNMLYFILKGGKLYSFKNVSNIKDQEKLGICSWFKEARETWQQNVIPSPRLDPLERKTYYKRIWQDYW